MIEWIDNDVQWLGQPPEEETQEGLSLGEKVLIVGVIVNVLGLAWQVYQWRQRREAI